MKVQRTENSASGLGDGFTEEGRNSVDREEEGGYFREWEETLKQRDMLGEQRGSGWLKLST